MLYLTIHSDFYGSLSMQSPRENHVVMALALKLHRTGMTEDQALDRAAEMERIARSDGVAWRRTPEAYFCLATEANV